jgi:hypothetical protein
MHMSRSLHAGPVVPESAPLLLDVSMKPPSDSLDELPVLDDVVLPLLDEPLVLEPASDGPPSSPPHDIATRRPRTALRIGAHSITGRATSLDLSGLHRARL